MNYVWKADCYLKGEKEQLKFYDKKVYESFMDFRKKVMGWTEISDVAYVQKRKLAGW